ncbi:MAG TPA: hypothetical protein VGK90_05335 [Rhizomicrobium sp.]
MADGTGDNRPGDHDVIADPSWFAEGFDPRSGEFLFVKTNREQLAAQAFLDWRWDRASAPRLRLARTALPALRMGHPPPRLIWHTGFCCSTLIAKSLDRPGVNLSLCEPQLLVDVAEAQRIERAPQRADSDITHAAFALLSRPQSAGERVTIKSSPAANRLLRTAGSTGPSLFLYSDCRSFLISIVKMGEDGRKYARRLFLALLADGHAQAQWPAPQLLSLSDLELAALVWHMQIAEFRRAWPTFAPDRAASLDCDALLAEPEECLHRLDSFFSLGIGGDHLKQVVAGPLFRRNAKTGEDAFDADRRSIAHERIAQGLGNNLARIVAQSYEICRTTPRNTPLPAPLLSLDKNYCP